MDRFTVSWVLFVLCVCSALGKPTKQKSSHSKTMVKRWDLILEHDPILLKSPPSDCQNIIDDYSNGKLLMYEYKIQMSRCMKKAKDDAEGTSDADVKSALLRPDDQPREDTDQAINVRPYNSDQSTATEQDSEDDYQTDNSDFSEHNNDNDNDYGDDDDDDESYDHDEQAAKKMQVPATAGYQTPDIFVQANTMPAQQQVMPGQQAASYYPNTAQMPYSGAPAQNPVPEQSQAAFVPSPMNQYPANPSAVQPADPNMGMNAVAKTNIPENTQLQPPANQANAVFDQWRASSFGAVSADKKDQMPSAPVAPVNDQFADFMKLQSSSSNPAEASPASQQAAMPAAIQQRTEVPQQPNMFPVQPQIPNTVPAQGQAFYMQPEEHGDFPENP
ncbi:B-cell linker protein-like isoform X2 [Orbicella faveolata]|uniref:B-cell linker protein-like isoform X2 n=1 Tax=Orbicella faveolata TaxID=48498 RepID=UPI0009E221C5|nr:B-cell linker protein-like isoform X2 [Orbicella faveolata]